MQADCASVVHGSYLAVWLLTANATNDASNLWLRMCWQNGRTKHGHRALDAACGGIIVTVSSNTNTNKLSDRNGHGDQPLHTLVSCDGTCSKLSLRVGSWW